MATLVSPYVHIGGGMEKMSGKQCGILIFSAFSTKLCSVFVHPCGKKEGKKGFCLFVSFTKFFSL